MFKVLYIFSILLICWFIFEIYTFAKQSDMLSRQITPPNIIWLAVSFSIFLSFLRIIILDGPVAVDDGYDTYAYFLQELWQENSIYRQPIRFRLIERHELRFFYPFVTALLSFLINSVILSGILISTISSIISVIYIWNLLQYNGLSYNSSVLLSIIFISNPTIMVNFSRFGTDQLFMLLTLGSIFHTQKYQNNGSLRHLRIAFLFTLTAIITREVGFFLLLNIVIWFSYRIIKSKVQIEKMDYLLIVVILSLLSLIAGLYLASYFDFLYWLMFNLIQAASTEITGTLLLSGKYQVFIFILLSKIDISFLEATTYAFGQIFLLISYNTTKQKKNISLSYPIVSFLLIFLTLYLLFKQGRTLDRFFIPIIPLVHVLQPNYEDNDRLPLTGVIIAGYLIFLIRLVLGVIGVSL